MKLLSREVSLTGIQHELHVTPHEDTLDVALASVSKSGSSTFHFMMAYSEVDSTILLSVALRNAQRLGHTLSDKSAFYIFENRYVALRLSEDEDGYYKLVVCADMNMLDLEKRPVHVYGRKYYIGSTALESKFVLKPFSHEAVLRYTREPIMPEELKLGRIYDSPIAVTRYGLIRFENDGATAILKEIYDSGKMSPSELPTRTSAFVKWINGDPDHARG